MILNLIFGSLALLSLALTLWQWLVARRFPCTSASGVIALDLVAADVSRLTSPLNPQLSTLNRP